MAAAGRATVSFVDSERMAQLADVEQLWYLVGWSHSPAHIRTRTACKVVTPANCDH
jgi:hypothetical protein